MFISSAQYFDRPDDGPDDMTVKAQRLRRLAERLDASDPEASDACRYGADVLESLAEPVVRWND